MWKEYSLPFFGADGFAARGYTRPRIPLTGEGKVLQSTTELETKHFVQIFVSLLVRIQGPLGRTLVQKQGFTTVVLKSSRLYKLTPNDKLKWSVHHIVAVETRVRFSDWTPCYRE